MRRLGEMMGHMAAERDIAACSMDVADCPCLPLADVAEVQRRGADLEAAEDAYIGRWSNQLSCARTA